MQTLLFLNVKDTLDLSACRVRKAATLSDDNRQGQQSLTVREKATSILACSSMNVLKCSESESQTRVYAVAQQSQSLPIIWV